MKILFFSSVASSLINFRGSLLRSLVLKGYDVIAIAPKTNNINIIQKELNDIGVHFISVNLSRNSLNPLKEFISLIDVFRIINRVKPNCILATTIKPIGYTGIVLKMFKFFTKTNNIRFYPIITGLGFSFIENQNILSIRFFTKLISINLYKFTLKTAEKVIFQNKDDQSDFYRLSIISRQVKTERIWGSGVDLNLFPYEPLPKRMIFLFVGRLLIDKGINEYIMAAREVKKKYPKSIFRIFGDIDSNLASINNKQLSLMIDEGIINYGGFSENIQDEFANCRFFVLPSYREGTPKSSLEALATGRPIITTDVPGCRETVVNSLNGYLVPPRDYLSLAKAMYTMIEQSEEATEKMGYESFKLAKKKYDVNKVNESIYEIINP